MRGRVWACKCGRRADEMMTYPISNAWQRPPTKPWLHLALSHVADSQQTNACRWGRRRRPIPFPTRWANASWPRRKSARRNRKEGSLLSSAQEALVASHPLCQDVTCANSPIPRISRVCGSSPLSGTLTRYFDLLTSGKVHRRNTAPCSRTSC